MRGIQQFFLVGLMLASLDLTAQPESGGPPPPNPVPITGVELLLAAGGLLGAKKLWDQRKERRS
jgi:hypothetical protein